MYFLSWNINMSLHHQEGLAELRFLGQAQISYSVMPETLHLYKVARTCLLLVVRPHFGIHCSKEMGLK